MRIRYQKVGMASYHAECDLPDRQAHKRFNELKEDGLCEWVELVGEDEEDYMEVLDCYDKTKTARMIASIIGCM